MLVVGIIGVSGYLFISAGKFGASEPRTIKMVIAHRPFSVFDRSTQVFADELARLTGGTLKLEIVKPSQIGYSDEGDISKDDVVTLLKKGSVQVSTAIVSGFEDQAPLAGKLDDPFAFNTYADAEAFLDGVSGKEILSQVSKSSSVEAIAFTFSGGFRSVALRDKSAAGVSALKGKRIVATGGKAVNEAFEKLGILSSDDGNTADGVEFTYTRAAELPGGFTFPTIVETRHGLLATMILVDDTFLRTLTPDQQDALKRAATTAAATEREDSIALADKVRSDLVERGVQIIEVSDEKRASLRK